MSRREELVRAFWNAAPGRVAEATESWLGVERGDREQLSPLRRLMHTIKGEAQMLGLDDCAALFERAESVIDRATKSDEIPREVGDALLDAFELLGIMQASDGGLDPGALTELCERLDAAGELLPEGDAPPSVSSAAGDDAQAPEPAERAAAKRAHALELEEVQPLVVELRRLASERTLLQPRLRRVLRGLTALERDPALKQALERAGARTGARLRQLVSELSSVTADESASEFASGRLLEQLDDAVQRASVVSLAQLEGRIHRVARGVASSLGKKVDVRVRGDAMIDAAIERRLTPALLHLVRNAIDHGIEDPAVRAERGKPERGVLEIDLAQLQTSARVVVQDDGGGIDFDRLRERLEGRGEDASTLTHERLVASLFEHGVSTREQATEISGRGVGLDVVASEVGAVGGRVTAESSPGEGTRFVLVMPATLRADVVVPATVGGTRCAVPARLVAEVLRIDELEHTSEGPIVRFNDDQGARPVVVRSLSGLLGFEESAPAEGQAAIVLAHPSRHFAVTVDAYESPRAVGATPIGDLVAHTPMVRAVAPTPDGGVLLVLDVFALHDELARGADTGASIRPRTEAAIAPKHVLVVEDAPVARELLCGILRSFGLRVSAAQDGRRALAIAREDRPDLVLTDIEMPVLGGLEMIDEMRRDRALRQVPVLVLSNRADEATRRRADTLGVRGFVAKQSFVESELRELVDVCLRERAGG